jgi:hypothetical protein
MGNKLIDLLDAAQIINLAVFVLEIKQNIPRFPDVSVALDKFVPQYTV